ncbi:MAG: nicotinate (nicotinamide) nucleotide adenylyltransferase [Anaerolineales bacterium]|nr:nicotinate (nicotinamide) nucleotide adenylyltransferase [Anaerolineales bacterium]
MDTDAFSPHKNKLPITPVDHRVNMLNMIVNQHTGFEISRVDLDRDPPHYAADTVEILRTEHSSQELIYIIGEDSLEDLPSWYEPEKFLANIDQLVVAPRPQVETDLTELERSLPGIKEKITFLSGTMLQISSSFIRARIRNGGPVEHLIIPEVFQYLMENGLYLKTH